LKNYTDYTNEITTTELYDGLVGCGLFAKRLPDFLSSKEFLDYSKSINLPIDNKPRDYIRYSSMRNINVPRNMAIPEPFAYASLCQELKINWDRLKRHFEKKTKNDNHKISRIHIRKLFDDCGLFEMNYKNLYSDGTPDQDLIIRSKYLAIADISQCFPSIYSHAIPWALKGKTYAKKNRDGQKWFNRLDASIRSVKYGETNGVLIGPHASNLISEIVLTTVDREMVRKGFKFIRHIDDYVCYAKSFEEAEKFHLDLSIELNKYELLLNLKKSEIISLPQASVKNWVNKLNHYVFNNTYTVENKQALRIKELKGFMDFAVELMLQEKSDTSVLNYAIKIIAGKHLGINAKNYFVKSIHHLSLLYPYLVQILDEFVFAKHNLETDQIETIANDMYHLGMEKKLNESCSYAISWALKYNFKLKSSNLKKEALKSNDCVFMLLAYIYHKKNDTRASLVDYKNKALELMKTDFDRYWLFIYEVLSSQDLKAEYKSMKQSRVSFLKDEFK
jgi:hypothetical protein